VTDHNENLPQDDAVEPDAVADTPQQDGDQAEAGHEVHAHAGTGGVGNGKVTEEYGADSITVLKGLEAVRKRPGMYIGSTGPRGLHHLVYEVVDNSVDEALAGYCDTIRVTLQDDGGVRVEDNGRGIPVDMHPVEGRPTVEVVMTILHAGGKFGGGGYAVSGGLHGVGISVVNALSSRVVTQVRQHGYEWNMEFGNGGQVVKELTRGEPTELTGTTQTFYADPTIFDTVDYDFETLRARFQQMAFLNKGLRIVLTDERELEEVADEVASDETDAEETVPPSPQRGLPLRRGTAGLRQAPQRRQEGGDGPPRRHRVRGGGHRQEDLRGDRHAVDQLLLGVGAHLRQHDQHARGRHPRGRLPCGADEPRQPLRQGAGAAQGQGRQPHR
jgi:hypothetical protein